MNEGTCLMTRDKLFEQLRPLDAPHVEALAAEFVTSARAASRAAVALSLDTDEEVASNARRLLLYLEDLAIFPLLEANPRLPLQRAALITQAVEAELSLRRKVMVRLDRLLDDTTPVPTQASARAEQKPPPRRICDEAYLLMRQVVHFGEPPMDAAVQAKLFLNAPDDFKDAQIKKARASGTWNRAITGSDIEDYADSHPDTGVPPSAAPAPHPIKR